MSLSFSNNMNSFNTFNTVYSSTFAGGRSQILTWLSPLEPRLQHRYIQERRVENVGEWVLQTEEFKNWCACSVGSESDNVVLFCYGDLGVGKTFIR